jgi:threonine dehydrogenase-like Zn-dependent dehydrogenase
MLATYLEQGAVSLRQTALPSIAPGFALLKLRLAGICNTDLELQRGYYGFSGIPGHEFVAEVVECADASWIGKRIVGEINLACGQCSWCDRDLGRHCPNRTVLGIVKHPGAFAEYLSLPVENLHAVPEDMPDEVAVFTEPVAAASAILEQVSISPGTPVAVLGDGKLGLLCAMVLALHGAQVSLYGRHPEKTAIAARMGVVPREASEAGDTQYPIVVEATGNADAMATAIRMTEARGKIIMKSTTHLPEISLIGSRCGRFSDALPLLAAGMLPVREMIHAEYHLHEAPAAFERAAQKGTLKVLLRP